MKSLNLELFEFPKFLVQVCDAKSMNFINWCRGSKLAAARENLEGQSPLSFAYPVQVGKMKASVVLPLFVNIAFERGEYHFTWNACVDDKGHFCSPNEVAQISNLDISLVAVKTAHKDLIVTFIPKTFSCFPIPKI